MIEKFIWIIRFIIKFLLQKLIPNYKLRKYLGIFRHGLMNDLNYANNICDLHFKKSKEFLIRKKNAMEIGPGDSSSSYYYFLRNNFKQFILLDHLALIPSNEIQKIKKDFSYRCEVKYLTKGSISLKKIPTNSLDFIFANSVFQHIHLNEISDFFIELNRVLNSKGVISLVIDFRDMINRSFQHHSVPDWIWESSYFMNTSIYTNRLLPEHYEKIFDEKGFTIMKKEILKFSTEINNYPSNLKILSENKKIYSCQYILKINN